VPVNEQAFVGPEAAEAVAREAMVFAYPMLFNYKTIWEQTQDPFSGGYIGGFKLPSRLLADNPISRYSIGDRTPGVTNRATWRRSRRSTGRATRSVRAPGSIPPTSCRDCRLCPSERARARTSVRASGGRGIRTLEGRLSPP
jgi:hypothetical protein